jgi:hypothetical protein
VILAILALSTSMFTIPITFSMYLWTLFLPFFHLLPRVLYCIADKVTMSFVLFDLITMWAPIILWTNRLLTCRQPRSVCVCVYTHTLPSTLLQNINENYTPLHSWKLQNIIDTTKPYFLSSLYNSDFAMRGRRKQLTSRERITGSRKWKRVVTKRFFNY